MSRLLLVCSMSMLVFLCQVSNVMGENASPYASFFGGLVLQDEVKNKEYTGTYNLSYEPGMAVGGAFGYRLGNSFPQIGKGRIEAELSYRKNDLDEVEFSTGTFPAGGDVSSLSLIINAITEYKTHPKFTPYFGLGLGAANVSMNDTRANGGRMIDDDDVVLAYQVMAGVDYDLDENWVLDFGYRFMGTASPEFIDSQQRVVTSKYFSHTFGFGIRFEY